MITARFEADVDAFTRAMDNLERKLRLLDECYVHRTRAVWTVVAKPKPVDLSIPFAMTAVALVASPKRFSRRSLLGLNWRS